MSGILGSLTTISGSALVVKNTRPIGNRVKFHLQELVFLGRWLVLAFHHSSVNYLDPR